MITDYRVLRELRKAAEAGLLPPGSFPTVIGLAFVEQSTQDEEGSKQPKEAPIGFQG